MGNFKFQHIKEEASERYNLLKEQLLFPIDEIESRVRLSAILLSKNISELDFDNNEIFNIENIKPLCEDYLDKIECKVNELLEKNEEFQADESNVDQSYNSKIIKLEKAFKDFKMNVSILVLKKNLCHSGIDIERL
ncbi:hypothetical protein [Maribacter sp. 1_MG-2023]|uniref:hypothetical protein n=1 Tax=Maribacter sp. 1_MG-2023 TaxID=3062677 RepID=UPI0026E38490|nr:hypothetical protein [Maribacter sp. 1_MG-2023]MDO6472636.1 hypothetical protein [Maribacter sp. 1_MG-2023]